MHHFQPETKWQILCRNMHPPQQNSKFTFFGEVLCIAFTYTGEATIVKNVELLLQFQKCQKYMINFQKDMILIQDNAWSYKVNKTILRLKDLGYELWITHRRVLTWLHFLAHQSKENIFLSDEEVVEVVQNWLHTSFWTPEGIQKLVELDYMYLYYMDYM